MKQYYHSKTTTRNIGQTDHLDYIINKLIL